jgi:hypothetical protein
MKRTISGVLMIVVGAAFVVATFTSHLFTVSPAFERMTGDFRPQMQPAALSQLRADLTQLTAVQQELVTKVVPAVSAAVHVTPAQFAAQMQRQFPAVSAGMAAVPQITTQFNSVLTILGNEQPRFAQADAIPTSNLPATTVPWLLFAAGILVMGAGALTLLLARKGAITAAILGGVLIIAPLAMSFPGKASAADTMNKDLKPVYTAQLVTGAKQSMIVMQQMGTEMQTKMLPALASMLKLQPAQLQTFLAKNFPVLAAGMAALPTSLGHFDALVTAFDHSLSNYDTAKGTSLTPLVWLMIGGGIVVIAAATVAGTKPKEQTQLYPLKQAA